MNEEEKRAFDSVQAEKKELGITDDPTVLPKEEVVAEPEKTEEKSKEEVVEKKPVESEKDEEESEDDEESDEKDESEESDEDLEDKNPRSKHISIKDHKEVKKALRDEIKSLKQQLEEKSKTPEEKFDIEQEVKRLSKELNFDESKTRLIIETARKGLDKKTESLSPEDKTAFEALKQKDFMREQESIFNGEWGSILPSIKKDFPNASDEQVAQAKSEMDKISHSKAFHDKDIDYVLFKNKSVFEKILFSPKAKTFESGRPAAVENVETPLEFSPDMTPAQFAEFEKSRDKQIEDAPREKLTITTSDDSGRTVQRQG